MIFDFIKQEKKISIAMILSLIIILFKIFTDNQSPFFPYAGQILDLFNKISLAIIATGIFYILQFFHTANRIRKIAQIEIKQLVSRALNILEDVYLMKKDIKQLNLIP